MKRKLCFACGTMALALAACSEDNGSNALDQGPVASVSSSSIAKASSSSLEQSSSSLFGLSSSAPVPESSSSVKRFSSSVRSSSSSAAALSSSSVVRSSSSESCVMKSWEQLGGSYPYVRHAKFCESSWPTGAIADGVWHVMETDSDISLAYSSEYGACCGNSSVVWRAGTSENGEVPDSTILACGGNPCGTAVLDKGTLTFQPFVSIGFTFARDSSGKPVPVDVSDWGGVCIDYASEAAPSLELDLGDSLNAMLGYAIPGASLAKSTIGTWKCIKWEDFKLPSWFRGEDLGWRENAGVKASKQLVGVKLRIQAESGKYVFSINDFSSYDHLAFDVFLGPRCI